MTATTVCCVDHINHRSESVINTQLAEAMLTTHQEVTVHWLCNIQLGYWMQLGGCNSWVGIKPYDKPTHSATISCPLFFSSSQIQAGALKSNKNLWVHYRLHIYPLCGIFFFPWHRHQIKVITGLWGLFWKTQANVRWTKLPKFRNGGRWDWTTVPSIDSPVLYRPLILITTSAFRTANLFLL